MLFVFLSAVLHTFNEMPMANSSWVKSVPIDLVAEQAYPREESCKLTI